MSTNLKKITARTFQTGRLKVPTDWTAKDGVCNSSDKFHELAEDVDTLIKTSATWLIEGNSRRVAVMIVAYLAHMHGMQPRAVLRRAKKSSRKKGTAA